MANLNETFEKPEFDWSAISVGDYKLDHSQNFFGNKENNSNLSNENRQLIFGNCATPQALKAIMKMGPQIENAALNNIELTQAMEQLELAAGPVQQMDEIEAKVAQEATLKIELEHSQNIIGNKENNSNLSNENRQLIFSNCATPLALKSTMKTEPQIEDTALNNTEATQKLEQPELAAGSVQQEKQRDTKVKMEEIEAKVAQKATLKMDTRTSPALSKMEPKQIGEQQRETKVIMEENDIENMPEADKPVARGNLRTQWSPIPHRQHNYEHHDEGAAAAAPKAYAFKDVYECNRQQALRRQEEEDRQARQFHSRPMPNFRALHRRIEDRVVVHRITVPRTPETVKYWQACVERRRQIKDEKEQEPAPPRHQTFNLRSEQRVRDRRDFDSAVQVRQAQKKKEQEEQRKRCEEEEIKEMRKMTVFKARPNPFK